MRTNELPHFDDSVNPTNCCPKFNPDGWDGAKLHFEDKPFLRAETQAAMHVPVNMGKIFRRVDEHVRASGGWDTGNMIVLSKDLSPWKAEHYFSVDHPVPQEEMTTLSGDFVTRVFEGPYSKAKQWYGEMEELARSHGCETSEIFFYTTCPKCAKHYGKNYVVGVARI
ncbi:hydrolase [Aliiruegeria lutimaris]|uniref:GyrI-like small molecule binding domain-containing protein n=1 Tax=Aliiruegeria lutimaris TaxID=571298 RepID=A0A1G8RA97_9RHOB|nr:hydrolase [Aliiruegeria lutimaris]SDJ13310.1 hypothetical protein SAMN04488026_101289 [Aliiruegeria lutimaris]